MAAPAALSHIDGFLANLADVERLLELHAQSGGTGPGRRRLQVLNKSGIVLLVACWEAFIEDLLRAAFDLLLQHAAVHTAFPWTVLIDAVDSLKKSPDDRSVWQLAGGGWRTVLQNHREACFKQTLDRFNTPRTEQVDTLCKRLIGLEGLSSNWHWRGVKVQDATARLEALVTLRGAIAHRVSIGTPVRKAAVESAVGLVGGLVVTSHQAVAAHLEDQLGFPPWTEGYSNI